MGMGGGRLRAGWKRGRGGRGRKPVPRALLAGLRAREEGGPKQGGRLRLHLPPIKAADLHEMARGLPRTELTLLALSVLLGFSRCGGYLVGYCHFCGKYLLTIYKLRLDGADGGTLRHHRTITLFQGRSSRVAGVERTDLWDGPGGPGPDSGPIGPFEVTFWDFGGLFVAHARPKHSRQDTSTSLENHVTLIPGFQDFCAGEAEPMLTCFTYASTYPHPPFDAEASLLSGKGGFLIINSGSEVLRLRLFVGSHNDSDFFYRQGFSVRNLEEGGLWAPPPERGEVNTDPFNYPSDSDSEGMRTSNGNDGTGAGWLSRLQFWNHLVPSRSPSSRRWVVGIKELRPWSVEKFVLKECQRLPRTFVELGRGRPRNGYTLSDYNCSVVSTLGSPDSDQVEVVCLVIVALRHVDPERVMSLMKYVLSLKSGRSTPDVLSRTGPPDPRERWPCGPDVLCWRQPSVVGFFGGFYPTGFDAPEAALLGEDAVPWSAMIENLRKGHLRDPRILRLYTTSYVIHLREKNRCIEHGGHWRWGTDGPCVPPSVALCTSNILYLSSRRWMKTLMHPNLGLCVSLENWRDFTSRNLYGSMDRVVAELTVSATTTDAAH